MYAGLLKEMRVHLGKHGGTRPYNITCIAGLSAVYILLVGHFPCYESPNLTLIKTF
jgi:hypothetical protein